jgi:DNA-binding winged helix-turn-helix (wHTH) protein/tetratricopeptide (TPR) repeat protein
MSRPQYEFEGFRVDAAQRRLYAAGASQPVDLPPRAFDALLHFLARPGELLTKNELMTLLWPAVVVEENSLNQVISVLRKALGEKPAEHRYIVTAPGRGYRFVAAVRSVDSTAPATAPDLSLAVLPFANLAATPETAHLGDGIAIDLIRSVSANSRIRVASHTASFAFREHPGELAGVAAALNVRLILEGHVLQSGTMVTVCVRLVDGRSGLQKFSRELSRDARDLAALQSELAREIRHAIDPDVPATPTLRAAVKPEAYGNYLKALAHTMRPSADSAATSIQLLREAVQIDAQFARARSLLAIQYTTCVMFGFPVQGALDLARSEAAASLAMDDSNGETHCAAAVIDCLSGAWCRAEERFRIAHSLSADPLISGLRCAYISLSVGHLHRAQQQAEYALSVAPTHPIGAQMLATLHQLRGDNDQARRYADIAVMLGQSRAQAPLTDVLALIDQREGRIAESQARMLDALPERLRQPRLLESAAALCELEAGFTPEELDPPTRKRLILWYACAGDMDRAYDLAHRSLDGFAREGTIGGAWGVLWLPEMARFRNDARFDQFARRLRLFEYWTEYGPPDGYSLSAERLVLSQ